MYNHSEMLYQIDKALHDQSIELMLVIINKSNGSCFLDIYNNFIQILNTANPEDEVYTSNIIYFICQLVNNSSIKIYSEQLNENFKESICYRILLSTCARWGNYNTILTALSTLLIDFVINNYIKIRKLFELALEIDENNSRIITKLFFLLCQKIDISQYDLSNIDEMVFSKVNEVFYSDETTNIDDSLICYKYLVNMRKDIFESNGCYVVLNIIERLKRLSPISNFIITKREFSLFIAVSFALYYCASRFFGEIYNFGYQGLFLQDEYVQIAIIFWRKIAQKESSQLIKYSPSYYITHRFHPKNIQISKHNGVVDEDPPFLIINSLRGNGKLLERLFILLHPSENSSVEYDGVGPSIPIAAAETIQYCLVCDLDAIPEVLEFSCNHITSDKWTDVYAGILALQCLSFVGYLEDISEIIYQLSDVALDIISSDIPILVAGASTVLISLFSNYSKLYTIENLEKVTSAIQNEVIRSNREVMLEYLDLVCFIFTERNSLTETEIFREFIMEILDFRFDPAVNTILTALLRYEENGDFLFNVYQKLLEPVNETVVPSSLLSASIAARFAHANCIDTNIVEIAFRIMDDLDVTDVPDVVLALQYCIHYLPSISEDFANNAINVCEKCFESGNPALIASTSDLIQEIIQKDYKPVDSISTILEKLKNDDEELLFFYGNQMLSAVIAFVKSERNLIDSSIYDDYLLILESIFFHPPNINLKFEEQREYTSAKCVKALEGLKVAIMAEKNDHEDKLITIIIQVFGEFLGKYVTQNQLYNESVLLAGLELLESSSTFFGSKIRNHYFLKNLSSFLQLCSSTSESKVVLSKMKLISKNFGKVSFKNKV